MIIRANAQGLRYDDVCHHSCRETRVCVCSDSRGMHVSVFYPPVTKFTEIAMIAYDNEEILCSLNAQWELDKQSVSVYSFSVS